MTENADKLPHHRPYAHHQYTLSQTLRRHVETFRLPIPPSQRRKDSSKVSVTVATDTQPPPCHSPLSILDTSPLWLPCPQDIVGENAAMTREGGLWVGKKFFKIASAGSNSSKRVGPAQLVMCPAESCAGVLSAAGGACARNRFSVTEFCIANRDTVSASLSLLERSDVTTTDSAGNLTSDPAAPKPNPEKEPTLAPVVHVVGALNFANADIPGGLYSTGSSVKAQEETICRQLPQLYATLVAAQAEGRYPIPANGALVSSRIAALRHPETCDLYLAPSPTTTSSQSGTALSPSRSTPNDDGDNDDSTPSCGFGQLTVISAAMPRGKADKRPAGGWHGSDWEKDVTARVRAVLHAAVVSGVDSLVLGAWGAGAFGNPPKYVAVVFRDVLMTDEFRGAFRSIVFAIIDPLGTGNLRPFAEGLAGLK